MTRGERWTYRLLMALGGLSLVAFYGWWFRPNHFPTNFSGVRHVVDAALFLGLTVVLSHRVFMDVYLWVVARKMAPRRPAPTPEPGLRVAFITTFVPGVEGLDLLTRTLPAMTTADYPHDTWLLDEGDDPAARALANALGVKYFTRKGRREYNLPAGPFTARTKGGNHNAWYDAHGHGYDVVAQIDTDFLPRHDFLTQTLGYFSDPTVGWVGTPQIYGNTEGFVARGAAEQQYLFYGPVLRGLAGRQLVNMLGANHVVRVAALREIRFYAGHLTEDLLTGMRLHARGWRSEYVAEPLAVGEGPDTWRAYFNQQMRWAYGCIDILRHHTPQLVRSMPRHWAGLYVSLQQGYFSGLAGLLGIGLLGLYFFGGLQISAVPLTELLIWGAPLYLLRQLIMLWLQRFSVRPEVERGLNLRGRLLGMAAWPIYLAALIGVLRQRPLVFKVTPKGGGRRQASIPLRLFLPHVALATISAGCLVTGQLTGRLSPVLVFWAAANVLLLGGLFVGAWVMNLRPSLGTADAAAVRGATAAIVPQLSVAGSVPPNVTGLPQQRSSSGLPHAVRMSDVINERVEEQKALVAQA